MSMSSDGGAVAGGLSGELPPNTEAVVEFASKHPEVFKLISEQVAEREQTRRSNFASPEYLERLSALAADYRRREELHPGDLVVWKVGMKNRKLPEYTQAAVVVEVLPEPERADRNPASAYFREPIDIALGLVDDDGDFVVFHFDSSRFTKRTE